MNVLITGSSGFLGKEVSLALKQKKYNIKYIIRKRLKNKNYFFCDLNNIKRLKLLINSLEIDTIVNLAGKNL